MLFRRHLYSFWVSTWHLLSITLWLTKKGDKLWLEIENEVMSERSTPNIYNLWLFYNFSKSCKKGVKYGNEWSGRWKCLIISFLYFGLVPNSPLQTARDAVGRWKMERGDVRFSQVHAHDGRTNNLEGPSSGALFNFNLTFGTTLDIAFLKFFQNSKAFKPIIFILSLLNYFSRLDLNFPVKYRIYFRFQ